jgi:hypothetical protein
MFTLGSFAVVFTAVSSVAALAIPRASAPAGWATALESYDVYHTRYMALGCNTQHNTAFFDQCCHPILASQNLETTLPKQCIPSTSSSADVTTTSASDDEYDDCDDDEADEPTSTSPVVTFTSVAPSTTHSASPTTMTSPTSTPTQTSQTNTAVNSGGFATYFYQNGVAGACGTVHQDTDMIAAIDSRRYGNTGDKSPLCGRKVKITNPANNKSVVVTIADACPTCQNSNSIDLSLSAFMKIAPLSQGMVAINWAFQ